MTSVQNVILVYITIPSLDSISSEAKLDAGSLDPEKNSMKDLMQRYTIKEVSLVCLSLLTRTSSWLADGSAESVQSRSKTRLTPVQRS